MTDTRQLFPGTDSAYIVSREIVGNGHEITIYECIIEYTGGPFGWECSFCKHNDEGFHSAYDALMSADDYHYEASL